MSIVLDGTTGITSPSVNAGNIVGQVCFFGMTTAPDGFLKANGAAISRSTYADLFAAIGTTYGSGDGSTTFNIPDLRGEFPRGWDDGRGVDSGRSIGTAQSHGIPRMRDQFADSHGNAAMYANDIAGFTNPFFGVGTSSYRSDLNVVSTNHLFVEFDSARVITEAPDVRPRNIALLACIKF